MGTNDKAKAARGCNPFGMVTISKPNSLTCLVSIPPEEIVIILAFFF